MIITNRGGKEMTIQNFCLRNFYIVPSIVVLSVLFLGGCGGGGDGDVVDTPATVPDVLSYEIKQADGIDLVIDQGGEQVTISSSLLTGSFERNDSDFTLVPFGPAMSVDAESFLGGLYDTQFNQYVLQVNKILIWSGDSSPTDGEFDIRDQTAQALIRVNITPTGVDLAYSPPSGAESPLSSSISWEVFDGLFEDESAEEYQRIAAFAYNLLRFMYEQGGLVIDLLEYLSDNDLLLEQNLSLFKSCDTYPYATTETVSDPGETLITWTDESSDGSLGPGDNFLVFFTECWDNEETDDFDQLYHGEVNLVNYVEVEDAGMITRVGFEPFETQSGGIDFVNFEIIETETEVNQQQVIIDEASKLILNGGFSMVFTSP
jgi:hypothetical protein